MTHSANATIRADEWQREDLRSDGGRSRPARVSTSQIPQRIARSDSNARVVAYRHMLYGGFTLLEQKRSRGSGFCPVSSCTATSFKVQRNSTGNM